VRSRSINSDTVEDGDGVELNPDSISSNNTLPNQHSENQEAPPTDRKLAGDGPLPLTTALDRGVKEAERGESREKDGEKEEQGEADRLFIHLRDNMEIIREFCREIMQQIPIPEQCVIEGNVNSFVSVKNPFGDSVTGLCSKHSLCNLLNLNEITVRCGGWG